MRQIIILLFIFSVINLTSHSQELKSVKGMYHRAAFVKGKIYTVNENQPFAEAVIVEGSKIIYVGSDKGALDFITADTKVVDLKGKLMLPGFNDTHLHFVSGGEYLLGINLRPAKSKEEFVQILKDYVEMREGPDSLRQDGTLPQLGRWVNGGRWDHESWEVIELPTKVWIDDVTQKTPVFISRIDGHMGLANSKALELAGITKDTPDPNGGLIIKDNKTGEPTGILKDNAMDLVFDIIPPKSLDDNIDATLSALKEAKKLGITSVQDMTQPGELEAYQKLLEADELTCRIYSIWPIDRYKDIVNAGITAGNDEEIIKQGALKGYADGSLGASTAWFFEPYTQDTTIYGLPMDIITNGQMEQWSTNADENRLQLCIHAIGDRANSFMLDLFDQIKRKNKKWDRRFRIEHAQHLQHDDIKRFSVIGVIASVQPYHCIDDGVWAEKRIGPQRIYFTHPYKSFLDNDVVLAFGTDWPVAPLNPLMGIYGAVTRRTVDDKNPDGWIPEQKISVEDAIKCYTINAAYASFDEDIKGSIEVGKLGDLVVLSEDILTIDPVKIKDVKVEMTVFDGKIVYKREE
jgi:predicted amidohydrolase YtcJ